MNQRLYTSMGGSNLQFLEANRKTVILAHIWSLTGGTSDNSQSQSSLNTDLFGLFDTHDNQTFTIDNIGLSFYPNNAASTLGISGSVWASLYADQIFTGATLPTAGQFLVEMTSANGSEWVSISGDISASTSTVGQITVIGIGGHALPALSSGYLNWTGFCMGLYGSTNEFST